MGKKWWFILICILLLPIVSAQYYDYFGGYGGGSFFYLYDQYYMVIDGIMLFVIFLVLSNSVFGKGSRYAKHGGELISIVMSLFLSFVVLGWEVENGYRLVDFKFIGFLIIAGFILGVLHDLLLGKKNSEMHGDR